MDERLKKQLIFALEIDKEKEVFRQTHLSGNGRNENDAEHAWHMAIMAYLLREYANQQVDIAKVLYEKTLMNNLSGHKYLYQNILKVVDADYKEVDYDWSGTIVKTLP